VDRMQGVQKTKCTNCGTMFMSETGTTTCPSCSELGHVHTHGGNSDMGGGGGCGCGHSH
jgi:Zn finger protein HypA/HybF involved in hydrogenase expression